MSYAAKFLEAHGQTCTALSYQEIFTIPGVFSFRASGYVSLKRASRSATNPGAREAYWEGLCTITDLASGEVVEVGDYKYLVLSAVADQASGETAVLFAKTNALLEHKRFTETVDENGNIIQEWVTLSNDVPAFGQIVTAALRQSDPGLLDNTKYTFQLSKNIGVLELDRIVYAGANYQVEAIDDVALAGVVRLQLSIDTRP